MTSCGHHGILSITKEVLRLTVGDRIRKLRKSLDLTQRAFGERINLKSNSIALIEGGRNTSDQTISAICREFNVSEEWLRTGEGEMFVPTPASELDALAARYPSMTHETYVFVEKLVNLPKESQDIIMGFLREVVEGFGSAAPAARKKFPQDAFDGDEEVYADMARQQRLLEKEQEQRVYSANESDAG